MWRNNLRSPLSTIIRKTLITQPISHKLLETNTTTQLPNFSTFFNFKTNPQTILTKKSQIHFKHSSKSAGFCSSGSPEKPKRCWNCNSLNPFMICESCSCVQPVDHKVDYFEVFGLEKKFDIDDGSLEGTYKNWQKKLHPDLVHTKSKEEREYAAEQSARIIDAYTTLRKPLLRAIYVMRLEGVEVDEEQTVSEPELLGEIMEIREAVEEASNAQALNKIQSQMDEKLHHWSDSFAKAFRSKQYDEALKSIQRMTYYHRVKEEILKKL